jgi:alpha-amylase/alpha-mannosidase (GH57 family)
MERYICIHCHFYQPPRENPWLEAVEVQDSAYPYHDWNERITAECYAANSASRILDGNGRITDIVNNYGRISFNFGPTLLSWMEEKAPEIYQRILDADRESQQRFSGHGSALAQAYNHMILPLANRRDRETQVRWGIRDFEQRFRRYPEGMWLPETAADVETLEILAENGIQFTILAPQQARQVRLLHGRAIWRNVEGGKIDPTRAYLCRLPSRKSISLFFYDGPISRAVAFEKLLSNGEAFAQRLLSGFSDARKWPQLMHIATDGETYGHHHPHGDMALAYALHYIETNRLAQITNYGEYLARHPPAAQAEIIENTSWSCVHGVERWRTDCGCNSGTKPGWTQPWRTPLRKALDWLRDALAAPYEETAQPLLKDPWAARDEYIRVMLDRSDAGLASFFSRCATRELSSEERTKALKLLEMQRHALLMYTSCGWFFDDLSGIETVQVIFYAARAIQLAEQLFGDHLEEQFLERLAEAHSNLPEYGTGAQIYSQWVQPGKLDLLGVAAHYAISSLFDGARQHSEAVADQTGSAQRTASIYCYDVHLQDRRERESGRARLLLGLAEIVSQITREAVTVSFGVLHLGDHNVSAGVRRFRQREDYEALAAQLSDPFSRADLAGGLLLLDKFFSGTTYSLKSLFRDEQRRTMDQILDSVLSETDASYRHIYELHSPLMRFLAELRLPLPRVLQLTAEFVLNSSLRRALAADEIEWERVRELLETAQREGVSLDAVGLGYLLKQRLAALGDVWERNPRNAALLPKIHSMVSLVRSLPFEVSLWKLQNTYFKLLQTVSPELRVSTEPEAQNWTEVFIRIGELLGVRMETAAAQEVPAAA